MERSKNHVNESVSVSCHQNMIETQNDLRVRILFLCKTYVPRIVHHILLLLRFFTVVYTYNTYRGCQCVQELTRLRVVSCSSFYFDNSNRFVVVVLQFWSCPRRLTSRDTLIYMKCGSFGRDTHSVVNQWTRGGHPVLTTNLISRIPDRITD